MPTKQCIKCGEEKELSEFYKRKINKKDSFYNYCKICDNLRKKEWIKNNPDKVKESSKKWRKNNPEKAKQSSKKWYINNRKKALEHYKKYCQDNSEKIKEKNRKYRENNTKKIKEWHKKYRQDNPKKIKESSRIYRQNNEKKIKEYRKNNLEKAKKKNKIYYQNNRNKIKEYFRNRKKIDIHFKLRCNISALISDRLRKRLSDKNGKSTFFFLPYTIDDLIKHLEFLFEPWMNWQNYGKGEGNWVIDHKKPDSLFNYTSVEDEEFQKCWALENLQPMEFIKNSKKSNKYINQLIINLKLK